LKEILNYAFKKSCSSKENILHNVSVCMSACVSVIYIAYSIIHMMKWIKWSL